jgi:hypothetical protein
LITTQHKIGRLLGQKMVIQQSQMLQLVRLSTLEVQQIVH